MKRAWKKRGHPPPCCCEQRWAPTPVTSAESRGRRSVGRGSSCPWGPSSRHPNDGENNGRPAFVVFVVALASAALELSVRKEIMRNMDTQ